MNYKRPFQPGHKKYGYVLRTLKRALTPVEELQTRTPQSDVIRVLIPLDKPLNENLILKRLKEDGRGTGEWGNIRSLIGEVHLLGLVRWEKKGWYLSAEARALITTIQEGLTEVHNFQA